MTMSSRLHCFLLLTASIALVAAPACAEPILTAYQAANPPAIDGVLSEPCWQAASLASPFLSSEGLGLPDEQTQVRACWDEANLYLGIEAFDAFLEPRLNMLHRIKAEKEGRDANVFSDDCVEIFLQPPGETYYQFAANSGTGSYESEGLAGEWNCDWRCVAKRGPRSYVVELAIPFAALGASPEGEWRANFCRERTAVKEGSTWSGLQGAFHQPDGFGKLRFAESGPALGAVLLESLEGSYRFKAEIAGATTRETVFEARLTSGEVETRAGAAGAGPHTIKLPIPKEALRAGHLEASYTLTHGGAVLVGSAPIPQALAAGLADLAIATSDATALAFLNGAPVPVSEGWATVELRAGLNVLTIMASATGENPWVLPRLLSAGHTVAPRWLLRSHEPPENWRTELPGEGWASVEGRGGWLWPASGAQHAYLACGLYVGKAGPQIFPKLDSFHISRGSKQLMKFYLHTDAGIPSTGYRMVVEVPEALKYVAVEPITGGDPEVVTAGAFEDKGAPMARYEVRYDMIPGQGMELSMRWGDESGSTLAYQPTITAGGTFDWRHVSMTITPPRGAVSAHPLIIKWQKRGIIGTFWVDNIVFREQGSEENLLKGGTFDEPEWGNHWILKPEGADGGKCVKIVAKPEQVDKQQALWVPKEGVIPVEHGKEYVIELDVRCENLGSRSGKPLCGLLFEAPENLAEGELPAYTYFQSLDGVVTELPHRSRVVILPPLKDVRPKRARICPCYYSSRFRNPEVAQAYAENCWASGITWNYGGVHTDVTDHLLERGHKSLLSIGWHPWGLPAGKREFLEERPELQAQDFKGKNLKHTVCPTWWLAEGEELTAALEEWLLAKVNGAPYFGANWDLEQPVVDPPTFCTCERCRAAFREFAGLPEETELNPDIILKQYRERWTDFRCAQNAEMAGHLKAILKQADRPIEFSLYSGYQSQRTKEHYGVDWKLMAPHLDLGIAGYGGGRGAIYATLEALGDVPFMGGEMWYLSPTDDARPAPRMETWRNRVLRQFVESGGNGCLIWWLPPMEGGSFYATSEAAEIIARYEDYFKLSQRCDAKVKVTGVKPDHWAAFEKDGKVLVLLLNFYDKILEATVEIGGRKEERSVEPFGCEVLVVEAG